MDGKPERMSEAVRNGPLSLPLRLFGRASSARWMPASTPMAPATMKVPSMRIKVPRIWSRKPPPVGVNFVHRTSHCQCDHARATTPMSNHAAGAMMRRSARYVSARHAPERRRRRRVEGAAASDVITRRLSACGRGPSG